VDVGLDRHSAEEATSKAALIRRFGGSHIRRLPPLADDPIGRMTGVDDFEPGPVDDTVYR